MRSSPRYLEHLTKDVDVTEVDASTCKPRVHGPRPQSPAPPRTPPSTAAAARCSRCTSCPPSGRRHPSGPQLGERQATPLDALLIGDGTLLLRCELGGFGPSVGVSVGRPTSRTREHGYGHCEGERLLRNRMGAIHRGASRPWVEDFNATIQKVCSVPSGKGRAPAERDGCYLRVECGDGPARLRPLRHDGRVTMRREVVERHRPPGKFLVEHFLRSLLERAPASSERHQREPCHDLSDGDARYVQSGRWKACQ